MRTFMTAPETTFEDMKFTRKLPEREQMASGPPTSSLKTPSVTSEERLSRKRMAARLRQQRCRARKRKVAMEMRMKAAMTFEKQDGSMNEKDLIDGSCNISAPTISPEPNRCQMIQNLPHNRGQHHVQQQHQVPPMESVGYLMMSNSTPQTPFHVNCPERSSVFVSPTPPPRLHHEIYSSPSFELALVHDPGGNAYVENGHGASTTGNFPTLRFGPLSPKHGAQQLLVRDAAPITPIATEAPNARFSAQNNNHMHVVFTDASPPVLSHTRHRRTRSEAAKREAVDAILSLKAKDSGIGRNHHDSQHDSIPHCSSRSGVPNSHLPLRKRIVPRNRQKETTSPCALSPNFPTKTVTGVSDWAGSLPQPPPPPSFESSAAGFSVGPPTSNAGVYLFLQHQPLAQQPQTIEQHSIHHDDSTSLGVQRPNYS